MGHCLVFCSINNLNKFPTGCSPKKIYIYIVNFAPTITEKYHFFFFAMLKFWYHGWIFQVHAYVIHPLVLQLCLNNLFLLINISLDSYCEAFQKKQRCLHYYKLVLQLRLKNWSHRRICVSWDDKSAITPQFHWTLNKWLLTWFWLFSLFLILR